MPASDFGSLRQPLETIMREAGDLARETSRRPFKRWTKGKDHSPVSEGDIAVNELLQARLSALVPEAGWLSEESELVGDAEVKTLTWIVDPIDGTRAYITGRADWTVSVALVDTDRPVLAALFAPATEEMFLGVLGAGATLNGAVIHTRTGGLSGARVAGPKRMLERIAGLAPDIHSEPKIHSLALRLARVAQGALDAAFASSGSHDWDLAAADLLVHEAGGVVTDFAGRTLHYNRPHAAHGALIATAPERHAALIDMVRDRTAEIA